MSVCGGVGGLGFLRLPSYPNVAMSLVVGVATNRGAAVAADSIDVDRATGTWSAGDSRHVAVGQRVAAVAGATGVGGISLLPWLEEALDRAKTLTDVPIEFLRAAGPGLKDAYDGWQQLVGPGTPAENFFTIIVASTEAATPALLQVVPFDSQHHHLQVRGDLVAPNDQAPAVVLTAGAVDPVVAAYREDGRPRLYLNGPQQPTPPDGPRADWASETCAQWAEALVRDAAAREFSLPRPAGWPTDAPVLAAPVTSYPCPHARR